MSIFDDENWKNFIIFGFWGTDEEYSKAAPFILIVVVIVVVLFLIFG